MERIATQWRSRAPAAWRHSCQCVPMFVPMFVPLPMPYRGGGYTG